MKKHLLYLLLFVFASNCFPQGLINNNAKIVFSSAAQMYIGGGTNGDYTSQNGGTITPSSTSIVLLEGDWNNNSANTGFSADAGTVQLVGTTQSIGGSNSTTFYNLSLLGNGTKTLSINTSVGGVTTKTGALTMGTQILDLNQKMLTISNSASTGINSSSTGFIKSETNLATNPSIVQWNVGTGSGSFVVPFGKTTTKIPLTITITSAMSSASDFFQVATRATGSDNTPWTTGVTNMYDRTVNGDGGIPAVIDRWWDFKFNTAATASITFNYLTAENTLNAPYNTANIGAQYWTAATGWIPDNSSIGSASASGGTITVTGIPFPANTLRPIVLSSLSAPLPIELKEFNATCKDKKTIISWATITENNNNYFTLEKSNDGNAFYDVAMIPGNGTSYQTNTYSFTDENANTTIYYRLKQTDFDGNSSLYGPISVNCANTNIDISLWPNPNHGAFTVKGLRQNQVLVITDVLGKIIFKSKATNENMEILLNDFATGVYNLQVIDEQGITAKKLIIE